MPNSRRESKEQKEQCQLQAQTYEENNVSKKEVGPMTRNKDTESHRHMAAEQELKVAEKAGEHQVEIEEEIEVERKRKLQSRKRSDTETTGGTANRHRSLKKPGRLQRRKPKNENMRWRLRSRSLQEAQEEAQSAAEVSDRDEQIAHNQESKTTSSRRRTQEPKAINKRTLKRSSRLSESIMNRSQRSDRLAMKPTTTGILRSRVVCPRTHSTT